MKLNEFIKHVLIGEYFHIQQGNDLRELFSNNNFSNEIQQRIREQQVKHMYLSFGLIAQGIELLGSLLDEHDIFSEKYIKDLNSKRFDSGLKLFDKKYHGHCKGSTYDLFKNLRCGMLHIVLPSEKIIFGEEYNKGTKEHLNEYDCTDNKTILFLQAEIFYSDFKDACESIINDLESINFFIKYPGTKNASQIKKDILSLKRDFLSTDLFCS